MTAVEVDFTIEPGETAADVLGEMARGLELRTEVLTVTGPAGGNPRGRITGSVADIEAFLRRHDYDLETYATAYSLAAD